MVGLVLGCIWDGGFGVLVELLGFVVGLGVGVNVGFVLSIWVNVGVMD